MKLANSRARHAIFERKMRVSSSSARDLLGQRGDEGRRFVRASPEEHLLRPPSFFAYTGTTCMHWLLHFISTTLQFPDATCCTNSWKSEINILDRRKVGIGWMSLSEMEDVDEREKEKVKEDDMQREEGADRLGPPTVGSWHLQSVLEEVWKSPIWQRRHAWSYSMYQKRKRKQMSNSKNDRKKTSSHQSNPVPTSVALLCACPHVVMKRKGDGAARLRSGMESGGEWPRNLWPFLAACLSWDSGREGKRKGSLISLNEAVSTVVQLQSRCQQYLSVCFPLSVDKY